MNSYMAHYTIIGNLPIMAICIITMVGWILSNFSIKKALILYPINDFKKNQELYASLFWSIGNLIIVLIIGLNINFYLCSVIAFPYISIRRASKVLAKQAREHE